MIGANMLRGMVKYLVGLLGLIAAGVVIYFKGRSTGKDIIKNELVVEDIETRQEVHDAQIEQNDRANTDDAVTSESRLRDNYTRD